MENLALASSKFSVVAGLPSANDIRIRRWPAFPLLSLPAGGKGIRRSRVSRFLASSLGRESRDEASLRVSWTVLEKTGTQNFASISSSNSGEISTVTPVPQAPLPPPPSYFGSPLFWVGVGVGLSALFSVVATRVKQYAMQQAFKTMMSQATEQNGQFSNAAFPAGSPFPFPSIPQSSPTPSSTPNYTSKTAAVVDLPPTKVEDSRPPIDSKEQIEQKPKKYAFIDVSPEEVLRKSSEYSKDSEESISQSVGLSEKITLNGAAFKQEQNFPSASKIGTSGSVLSVEALEKMMEDPNVQKLVFPYLPEEMRNPTTFKWMLQNPQYRQQLQDMLNSMGGSSEWDNRMMDTLKNFDLSSPEVKQQFDQVGLTPEEVISKIMANPDVALAFQNPKVQAAIMDCSQNPLSIAKYQNDKEVMDVFTKISELFPGVSGSL
ncbi:protein TIC 40, chloroplastic-like isoform X2 [Phalaenopsis equestris]|uniref:protein TIC 40, chloroplastic-like isoform X2 n=1 Tax=Phalaenopsis equestris TaxID=78828 RepID=UPI0009E18E13|nr:protein TIC 40, chloroplastic-like isoform X2 [Phalaenopsis equestris]